MTITGRKLSAFETGITYRDTTGAYSCFVVAAQYRQRPARADLLPFLTQLCEKYPQLTLQVREMDRLEPLDRIAYDQVVSQAEVPASQGNDRTSAAVTEIMQTLTREQFAFGVDQPLWKLVIWEDVLFFSCQHTILDGTAGKRFHDMFAEYLENTDFEPSESDLIFDLSKVSRFNIGKSPPDLLQHMGHPEGWQPVKFNPNAVPIFDKQLLFQPIYYHRSTVYNISPENVQKLLQRARQMGVKLTSLLFACVSIGLKNSGILVDGGDCITSLIAINARIFIDDPETDHAMHLLFSKFVRETPLSSIPMLDTPEFEKYCLQIQSDLTASFPESWYSFSYNEELFKQDPSKPKRDMENLVTEQKNLSPSQTLTMSNIGTYKSDLILNAWFDQPVVDAAFSAHIISSKIGGLNINFISHRAVRLEDYTKFIRNATEIIEHYLNQRF